MLPMSPWGNQGTIASIWDKDVAIKAIVVDTATAGILKKKRQPSINRQLEIRRPQEPIVTVMASRIIWTTLACSLKTISAENRN